MMWCSSVMGTARHTDTVWAAPATCAVKGTVCAQPRRARNASSASSRPLWNTAKQPPIRIGVAAAKSVWRRQRKRPANAARAGSPDLKTFRTEL